VPLQHAQGDAFLPEREYGRAGKTYLPNSEEKLMPQSVLDRDVTSALEAFRMDAGRKSSRTATVDGKKRSIPYPFPSPEDWRDSWIYFVLTDRFNNPDAPPRSTWNRKFGFRQGGTFNGIRAQLPYIRDLGATALWLSPVLKNSKPDTWEYNYPGYSTQDFLGVDERFASDGKTKTAERELTALVNEAHALGIHVILDIVLNHAARVFDYDVNGNIQAAYKDAALMAAPLGQEQPIVWLDGTGAPRWATDIPDDARLTPDDAVWPRDLQRKEFFRRRGDKLDDNPGTQPEAFVRGDFGSMRQLTVEYDAQPASERAWRELYGKSPVLSILIRAYEYAIARYDFDGFRIDTVKYVHPAAVETFGNAIREFALSGGKRNFFT
jgi:glycosidase